MIWNRLSLCSRSAKATILLCGTLLSGCSTAECGWQSKFVDSDSSHEFIIQWADAEVFSRKYSSEDVFGGRLAGPGRVALRINKLGIPLPEHELSPTLPRSAFNIEVRLIGDDINDPIGVFFGQSSYRGVIIAKSSIEDAVNAGKIELAALSARRGRVGLVCVSEH